ncbi:hypothetical protein ABLE92_13805 [Gordonia sp. VNQ95]|uniref:hypothetical protein n=1 Tax=Gordonia TaxID=2053 RepID=UPI0032B3467F
MNSPQPPQGQSPYGQPQYGQPQYGQPQQGQPQYGPPPQYGQPQYGQPQHGQPQHGQPQYRQPGQEYGQPPASPAYGAAPAGYGAPAQQPAQQSYPAAGHAAPPAHPGPQGVAGQQQGIALTTKYFPLSWMLAFFKPKISVDGHELPVTSWGRNEIPLPPGQHHLHVHVPYLLPPRIGPADLPVMVHPGQPVELEYRAPVWVFSGGSLGPAPQKYNGMGATIAIFAVSMFLLLIMFILMIVAASAG